MSVCQCVVCLSATATMQTFPCAHRVTCRRCFVRTIQTAIGDRNLPLRCVVCRARILTLNEPPAAAAAVPSDDHAAAVQSPSWSIPAEPDRCPCAGGVPPGHPKDADGLLEVPAGVGKEHAPRTRLQKQSSDDVRRRFVGK